MHLSFRIASPMAPTDKSRVGPPLSKRAGDSPSSGTIIIIAAVAGSLFFVLVIFLYARSRKIRNKKGTGYKARQGYAQASSHDDSTPGGGRTARPRPPQGTASDMAVSETTNNRNSTVSTNVERNTSIRSIMTLPAYRTKANDNEQVLGREGERDGVDEVIEMPTVEEMEAMREDEMENMYQIRLARRTEIAEREERRRLRREARARGDSLALNDLNARARAASQSTVVSDLREENERIKTRRQRATSSVSYEGLGIATLDGSRVRANSQESERMGLLSDAASIALSTRSPSALSHRRDRSTSSVLSFDTSQDFPSPGGPRSGGNTPRRLSAQHIDGTMTAGSSPEIIDEADLGEIDMPAHDPPGYDDVSLNDDRSGATTPNYNEPPPGYPGPLRGQVQRFSSHSASVESDLGEHRSSSRLSRNSSSISDIQRARLPSITIGEVPQIIVEPSSAYPRDRSRDR